MKTFMVVAILSLLLVGTFAGQVAYSQLSSEFTSPDSGFFGCLVKHEGTGEMWAGTYGGRIFVKRGGVWQLHTNFSSIAESIYRMVYHPGTNTLYANMERLSKAPCIYRLDGDTWVSTGYGSGYSESGEAMGLGLGVGADGYMYAGVTPYHEDPSKGYVWRTIDGVNWSSFTSTPSVGTSWVPFGGQTYAGTTFGTGDLLRWNGSNWQALYADTNAGFAWLKEFKGNLYASGGYGDSGVVYRWNGSSFTKVFDVGSGGSYFHQMAVVKDAGGTEWLYAAWSTTWRGTGGGARIYRSSDGTNWSLFQTFSESECWACASQGEYTLYVGTRQDGGTGKMYICRFLSADTSSPSVPTNVQAATQSPAAIQVTWTASTDNVGVTGYRIYRNVGCVGTSATTSYTDSGLAPSTTYSYKVQAYDVQGNVSAQSSPAATATTSADTQAPSVPTNVQAVTLSYNSILVNWTASTDNGTVAGYKIYRNASQVGTSATASYLDTGLSASTTYSYKVSAYDTGGNESAQSSPAATATTLAAPTYCTIDLGSNNVSDMLSHPQNSDGDTTSATAGNLECRQPATTADPYYYLAIDDSFMYNEAGTTRYLEVNYFDDQVSTVYMQPQYDSTSNAYLSAGSLNFTNSGKWKTATWTLTNCKFANRQNVGADFRIAFGAYSVKIDSVRVSKIPWTDYTSVERDLGSSEIYRGLSHPQPSEGDTVVATVGGRECRKCSVSGDNYMYFNVSDAIIYDGSPSTVYLKAAYYDSSGGQILPQYDSTSGIYTDATTLSFTGTNTWKEATWTFSNAKFANRQDGSADFRLNVGTSQNVYIDKVTVSKTPFVSDTTPPSVPTGVTAIAQSQNSILVSWTASTDDFGVAGYKVYRNGSQVGTSGTTSYTDTELTPSTAYSYTVSAYDGANNNSAQSSPAATATTFVADTQAPSVPTGVTATAQSSTSILVAWTASTDNVGVTGYKVYRNASQVGTSASTSYTDTGLSPSTTYSYTVSAYDAAGNNSAQSSPAATATTQSIPVAYSLEDFETATAGPLYHQTSGIGWANYWNGADPADTTKKTEVIQPAGSGTNQVLAIYGTGTPEASRNFNESLWTSPNLWVYLDYTIYASFTGDSNVYLNNGSSTGVHIDFITGSKLIRYRNDSGNITIGYWDGRNADGTTPNSDLNFAAGWRQIRFKVNVPANTYSLWIGDPATGHYTKMFEDYAFRAAQPKLDHIRFLGGKTGSMDWNAGATGVDNIYISNVVPDNQAPSVPATVAATAKSPSAVRLTWTASTDNVGVTGYKVYRGGSQVGTSTTTSYTDTGLSQNTTYSYMVSAYDASGNNSAQSSPSATATTMTAISIAASKQLSDGASVGLVNKIVTAIFSDCFYIEETDRRAGIKVVPAETFGVVAVGSLVDVGGIMQTVAGQRSIGGATVSVR